jgi:dUTP pyrophosphatase
MMDVKIRKIRENSKLPEAHNGCWADTYVSKIGTVSPDEGGRYNYNEVVWYDENKHDTIHYVKDDVVIVKLGFALQLPPNHELHLLPRSSTFKNTGLLLTNSMGIGDTSYCGNEDEYSAMFFATRAGEVSIGQRIIQIKIEESTTNKFAFVEVEDLGNPNRGGFGSTGE